jgi:hypothetical protein
MRIAIVLVCACRAASSAPDLRDESAHFDPSHTGAPASAAAPRPAHAITIGDASVTGQITAVRVIAAIDDGAAHDGPIFARADQVVHLHALVDVGAKHFSDARQVIVAGKKLAVRPLSEAPAASLAWQRVEPAAANYSNTDIGEFHFTPIEYRTTAIEAAATSLVADVRPTLTPDHGNGVGTMRFQLVATQGDRTIASPGPEARRGRGSGGLADSVFRVSIRKDDTYLGYLTEMFGQPYVWASAGLTDRSHQSEHLEGADCADFVVYGARRMGKPIAYTWTGGLPGVTKLLGAGERDAHGIYRDAAGEPVPFTRAGDMILFPRHVGVLVEDRGTNGVLDDADLMMHTLFDSPKTQPIADSGYADKPVEVRRFK